MTREEIRTNLFKLEGWLLSDCEISNINFNKNDIHELKQELTQEAINEYFMNLIYLEMLRDKEKLIDLMLECKMSDNQSQKDVRALTILGALANCEIVFKPFIDAECAYQAQKAREELEKKINKAMKYVDKRE